MDYAVRMILRYSAVLKDAVADLAIPANCPKPRETLKLHHVEAQRFRALRERLTRNSAMGMLSEVKTTSTVGRSLQVLLLAFCGLLFYAGVIVLIGFAGAFVLSAYTHAQPVQGNESLTIDADCFADPTAHRMVSSGTNGCRLRAPVCEEQASP